MLKATKFLKKLKHTNILVVKDIYKTSNKEKQQLLCIVTEYVGEENLQDLLEQIGKIYLTEQKVLNWFIQICLAVQHFHKRKMICRDLQLHNIFFDSKD